MSDHDLIGLTVLVVDEDAFLSKIIISVLGAFEFGSVIQARTVAEAIGILATSRVNCVVCDWLNEAGKGLELVEFLRQDDKSPNPEIPVVLCTALTDLTSICGARVRGRRNLTWDGEERRGKYGLNQDQIVSVMQREITAGDGQEMAADG